MVTIDMHCESLGPSLISYQVHTRT